MSDFAVYGRLDELQERVARLEGAVAAIAAAAGVTLAEPEPDDVLLDDPVNADVVELLRSGKRSKAVKLASKELGLDLKEATEHIGRLEASL